MCRVGRRFSAAPLLADLGSRRSVSPTSMALTTVSVRTAEVASSKAVEGAGFPLWLGRACCPPDPRGPPGANRLGPQAWSSRVFGGCSFLYLGQVTILALSG